MNVVTQVQELQLPLGEYIVLGSGILGALGIREIGDIDLLVSPRVFDELRKQGWDYSVVEIEGRNREKLTKDIYEVFKDFWYGDKTPDPAQMISEAEIVDEVPFLSLKKLLEIKRAMNRPKDLHDIELIEAFLAK